MPVRDALGWLFGPDGEATLVRTLRRANPALPPSQIKAALGQIGVSIGGPKREVAVLSGMKTPSLRSSRGR